MNPKRKQRLILILLGTSGVAVAVLLVLFALGQNMNFFYSPSDIAKGDAPLDRDIRAGGMVKEGSVQRDSDSLRVSFVVTDFASEVQVNYEGILPFENWRRVDVAENHTARQWAEGVPRLYKRIILMLNVSRWSWTI